MLKPMAVYWRSVLTFESVDPRRRTRSSKALVGQKVLSAIQGKFLSDEETKKISRALADLVGENEQSGGNYACRLLLISYLIWQITHVHFFRIMEILAHDLTHSRRLPTPLR